MGNAEEPPVNTESIFAFETYGPCYLFLLKPHICIEEHHHVFILFRNYGNWSKHCV